MNWILWARIAIEIWKLLKKKKVASTKKALVVIRDDAAEKLKGLEG